MPQAEIIYRSRVMGGLHHEPVPGFTGHPQDPDRLKVYKRGEIVESTRDLVKVFPNQFKPVSDEEMVAPIDQEARKKEVDGMIQNGHWNEEDRKFLQGLSEENFKRLNNRFSQAITAKSSEDRTLSTLGEDVTSNFQLAYDSGYKVFKNAKGKFQVTKKNDVNKPLNKEALDQAGVDKFVEQYLRG